MDDAEELAKRLSDHNAFRPDSGPMALEGMLREAAGTIRTQAQEIERLRARVEVLEQHTRELAHRLARVATAEDWQSIDAARAALKGEIAMADAPEKIKAWGHSGDNRPIRGFLCPGEPWYEEADGVEYTRTPTIDEAVRLSEQMLDEHTVGDEVRPAAWLQTIDEALVERLRRYVHRPFHASEAAEERLLLSDLLKAIEGDGA